VTSRVGLLLAIIALHLIAASIGYWLRRRRKKRRSPPS